MGSVKATESVKIWQLSFITITSTVEPEESYDVVEEKNEVGDFFWPIVCLLKFIGNCPLSYVHREEVILENSNGERTTSKRLRYRAYQMEYMSPFTILSLISGVVALILMALQVYGLSTNTNTNDFSTQAHLSYTVTLQNYLGEDVPGAEESFPGKLLKIIFYSVSFILIFEILFSWTESRKFGIFLNTFQQFQREYNLAFPFVQDLPPPNIHRVRNLVLFFYVFIPSLFSLMMALYFNSLSESSFLGFFTSTMFILELSFASLLEDTKVILTYYLLGISFKQIRSSIILSMKRDILTPQKVKSWRQLVHLIRVQANFAGDLQKCHQLMLFIGSIVLMTGLTFLILTINNVGQNGRFFVIMQTSYVFLIAGRIYLKIHAANFMSHQESLIARELILMNIPEKDFSIQLEVKFLHDMIKQKPCLIKFGSYATMNKRLILGVTGDYADMIGSQVVTYLIVLMQFFQSQS